MGLDTAQQTIGFRSGQTQGSGIRSGDGQTFSREIPHAGDMVPIGGKNKSGHPEKGCPDRICWRAPSERIRTASEIPIEVDLTDEDAIPVSMKVSEKVLHLRRLGMSYTRIADRLGVNLWMAKKSAHWGKTNQ